MPSAVRPPVVFLSHGAPPLADDPTWTRELRAWGAALPRPTDVLVVSAERWGGPRMAAMAFREPHLIDRLKLLPNLKVIVTLGDVSRRNILKAFGRPASAMPAGHGAQGEAGGYVILNSYHCSRLNTNTGRLTPQMFEDIFARARTLIEA